MKITAWEADQILTRDLRAVEATVSKAVKVPLNQNEFDALVSFVFNVGGTAFKNSTLLKRLNAGDRTGAGDQFLVWNKITKNGKKVALAGLTTRRQDERRQFLNKQQPVSGPPPLGTPIPGAQPAPAPVEPAPQPQSPPPEPDLTVNVLRAALVFLDRASNLLDLGPPATRGPDLGSEKAQVRPVEMMLLGSIVGLGIAFLWVWISVRAGRY